MTTDDTTNGPPGPDAGTGEDSNPRGYAQYTAQVSFFTDDEQAEALGRAKIKLSRSRAEILREALDLMLPTMVTEYRTGKVKAPRDRVRGSHTVPINFNTEPSMKELIETLASARSAGQEGREAMAAVIREAIDRGLPKLTGAARGSEDARSALIRAVGEVAGGRPAQDT